MLVDAGSASDAEAVGSTLGGVVWCVMGSPGANSCDELGGTISGGDGECD